jgi:hypothetical protein
MPPAAQTAPAAQGAAPAKPPVSEQAAPSAQSRAAVTRGEPFERPHAAPTPPSGRGGGVRVLKPGVVSGIAVAAVAGVLIAGAVSLLGEEGSGTARDGSAAEGGARPADKIFAVAPALYDGHEQSLNGAAVRGETAVTIGAETADRPRGQFLVSSDGGREWRLATVRTSAGDGAAPPDVPRVIATGSRGWAALGDGDAGVATWTSPDGRTWTHRPAAGGAFAPGDKVTALASTQSGFAAMGVSAQGRPVLWTSADGVAWQRSAPALPDGADAEPARLAASGSVLVAQARGNGDLWRSADGGRSWSKADIPQSGGSYGPVVALTAGPGGVYAAREGRSGKGRKQAVFFRSADGVSWGRASVIDRGSYERLAALGGSDGGLAALVPLSDGRIAVQRSADGSSWTPVERLEGEGGRTPEGAAALPQGVLVLGRQDTGAYLAVPGARGGDVDLLGIPGAVTPDRTVTRLVSGGGTVLAIGSGGGDGAVWSTRDGRTWSRAGGEGLAGPGLQRLAAAAYGPRGWVAVGRGADRTKPILVTSQDGTAWKPGQAIDQEGELSGAAYGTGGYVAVGTGMAWQSGDLAGWTAGTGDLKDGTLRDVAAVSNGYVAVGERKDQGPTAWTSADGKEWTAVAVPRPQGVASATLSQVAARGDALVAIGSGGGQGFVASSSDAGRTWRTQPLPAVALTAVMASPRGFTVAGDSSGAGRSDVSLWTSADGSSWRQSRPRGRGLDGDGLQRLTALTVHANGLLAVGSDGTTPTLWQAPLP